MNAHSNIQHVERYRLAPLRDLRRLDERAKRNDLAVTVDTARVSADDVAAAAARVEAARTDLAAAHAARAALTDAHLLALGDRYLARLRRVLADALAAHARARAAHAGHLDAVDAARSHLAAARAQKELVERHFARWRDAQRKLAERRED
jgi:hypothetical protein